MESLDQLRHALSDAVATNATAIALLPGTHILLGGSPLVIPTNKVINITSAGQSGRSLSEGEPDRPAVIDGQGLSRLFDVEGRLQVENVALIRGHAQFGGVIEMRKGGSATFTRCLIADCRAISGGDSAYGNAQGGAFYVGHNLARLVLQDTTIKNCTATSTLAAAFAEGGAVYVLDGKVELHRSRVTGCSASTPFARNGRGGGIFIVNGSVTMTDGSQLMGNSASGKGATLMIRGGQVMYFLPAPPGHWAPVVECLVYREGCPHDDKGNVRDVSCDETADACRRTSTNSLADGKACAPALPLEAQPCNWKTQPTLIGSTFQVLPHGPLDVDYPIACAPGILGSNDSSYQASIICAGLCPAGLLCPSKATVKADSCLEGHFCPAGSSVAFACPAGTYSPFQNLTSSADCKPCPIGHSCALASTTPQSCLAGTYSNSSGSAACKRCTPGTFANAPGSVVCALCAPGHW